MNKKYRGEAKMNIGGKGGRRQNQNCRTIGRTSEKFKGFQILFASSPPKKNYFMSVVTLVYHHLPTQIYMY